MAETLEEAFLDSPASKAFFHPRARILESAEQLTVARPLVWHNLPPCLVTSPSSTS